MKKVRYSPQIGEVMVSHHNMVSPQNGDTQGGPPPLAMPLPTGRQCVPAPKDGFIRTPLLVLPALVLRTPKWYRYPRLRTLVLNLLSRAPNVIFIRQRHFL